MGEKGQSLVEFAISFVVIMLLLSGVVEFGIAFFQLIQLRDAAQEGALFGSICQDTNLIEERARYSSNSPLDLSNSDVQVKVSFSDDNGQPSVIGDGVTVRVEYDHVTFMPFFTGRIFHLHGQVTDTILANMSCP